MKKCLGLCLGLFVVLLLVLAMFAGGGSYQVDAAPLAAATPVSSQSITWTGTTPTFNSASAATNTFVNDGSVLLYIKNTDVTTSTAILTTPRTVNGLAVTDLTITLVAATDKVAGPFPPETFNDSDGKVTITWSNSVSQTFAVLDY